MILIVRNRSAGVTQSLWGQELMEAGRTPTADYGAIMEDDRALLSWLEDLDRFGFVLVKNVPVKEGPVPALQVSCSIKTIQRENKITLLRRSGLVLRR